MDELFKKILFTLFPYSVAKVIYDFTIEVIALFRKIGIYLTLPFLMVRKFCQIYKERTRKQKEQ